MGRNGVVALVPLLCLSSVAVGAWARPVATKDKDAADDEKFLLVIHARRQSAAPCIMAPRYRPRQRHPGFRPGTSASRSVVPRRVTSAPGLMAPTHRVQR